MFPSHGDQIDYNEAGEPVGWSAPADPGTYWCDTCGFSHGGDCPEEPDEDYDADDAYWDVAEHTTALAEEREDETPSVVIERCAGETYLWDGKTYAVYRYDTYPSSSVQAGRERRTFLDSSTDLDELKRKFPDADDGSGGSGYMPTEIPHTAPAWFREDNAGEIWDDKDY